jgi:hypothetical protein
VKKEQSSDRCITGGERATALPREREPRGDRALGMGQPGRFGYLAEPVMLGFRPKKAHALFTT